MENVYFFNSINDCKRKKLFYCSPQFFFLYGLENVYVVVFHNTRKFHFNFYLATQKNEYILSKSVLIQIIEELQPAF